MLLAHRTRAFHGTGGGDLLAVAERERQRDRRTDLERLFRMLQHYVIVARCKDERAVRGHRHLIDHRHGRRAALTLSLMQHGHAECFSADADEIDRLITRITGLEIATRWQVTRQRADPAVRYACGCRGACEGLHG